MERRAGRSWRRLYCQAHKTTVDLYTTLIHGRSMIRPRLVPGMQPRLQPGCTHALYILLDPGPEFDRSPIHSVDGINLSVMADAV